jgi:hypothetical protein
MLTAIDRHLLHACRAKRYRLTEAQRVTKKVTGAPHAPGNSLSSPAAAAQYEQQVCAGAITALHIIEAEIRGLKPAHRETYHARYMNLFNYRGGITATFPEEMVAKLRAEFDAWLAT